MAEYENVFLVQIRLNDAATTDEDYYAGLAGPSGSKYYLQEASFMPMTSVAQDAAEYRTIAISDGTTTFGTISTVATTGTGALTAGTPEDVTLSGKREFLGDTGCVKVASTHTGSTGKVADGILTMRFVRIY